MSQSISNFQFLLNKTGFLDTIERHRFQIPEGCHWDDIRSTAQNVGSAIEFSPRCKRVAVEQPSTSWRQGSIQLY